MLPAAELGIFSKASQHDSESKSSMTIFMAVMCSLGYVQHVSVPHNLGDALQSVAEMKARALSTARRTLIMISTRACTCTVPLYAP